MSDTLCLREVPVLPETDAPVVGLPAASRRGQANSRRRGKLKIHRRYRPGLHCSVPRGFASKVVARISRHDWHRNPDLVALRHRGYIPYTRRRDPNYTPKPLRLHARTEACEALTALSQVMAAHCDYNPDSEYAFEVMAPMEHLARFMGVLHIYENGRKAYDVALNALSVLEQLEYVTVLHGRDTDSGQNKPLRIWLSERFFTARGIAREEIRRWLGQFRTWATKNGLSESLRSRYDRHLLRLEHLGIGLKNRHALRNRLKQLRRRVMGPELQDEQARAVTQLEGALAALDTPAIGGGARLDTQLDTLQTRLLVGGGRPTNPYYQAYVRWSLLVPPAQMMILEGALRRDCPGLLQRAPESYYRQLLERAGAHIPPV